MRPSTGSPYPVVVFRRHQYERATAMACDLNRLAASGSVKPIKLASEPRNRRRGHGGRSVLDRLHDMAQCR